MNNKRLRCWVLLFVVSCFFPACEQQPDATIRFGLSAGAVTLDPRFATDAVSHRINRLLYQQLVTFDDNYQFVPALAGWEQVSPVQYRFHLEPERRDFHNSAELTAADVKATYASVLDPATVSPHRSTLTGIASIEVIDSDTIDFHLEEPDPLFPGRLVIGIMPAELIEDNHPFNEQPVGSGPLQFRSWDNDDVIRLERLADGQKIEFVTVRDSTVRLLKLVRGEIDLVQGDIPFELLDWLTNRDTVIVEQRTGDIFTYLGFNLRDPVLQQLPVRQAIAAAIDRPAIIRHVLGDAARRAGSLLPPDHWAGHPDLHSHDHDPDRARQLLAEAGYVGKNALKLTYKTSNNPLRVRLATIIQQQLSEVGIAVEVQSYDWGTFYGDIKSGKFQIYSLSWVGLNMPDIFRYVFHSDALPPEGANRGAYSDPVVDGLIEEAEKATDPDRQAALYRDLQERLHARLPYVPLWYEDNILARRRNVQGYTLHADGNYDSLVQARKQTSVRQ